MKRFLAIPFLAFVATASARADSPAPKIALSVDGHFAPMPTPQTMWRGEPVIVAVVLRHPDPSSKTPISLDPPEGDWAARVKIVVKGADGAVAAWPFVVAGKPSGGALALQPDAVTTLVLRIDTAALAGLAAGRYHLVARLELKDGRGWQGEIESAAAELELVEPPAAPEGAELGRRQIRRAQDALLIGDLPRAEVAAGEMLFADRERPEGWVALALLLEAKGESQGALSSIETAIALASRATKVPGSAAKEHPPVAQEYEDLRRRLEAQVADSKPGPEVPAVPEQNETAFLGDKRGQWATGAEASSELQADAFSARQATGPPNAKLYGLRPEAWTSKTPDGGEEWLKLTFATPVRASAVRVRQNANPGAITKIEAFGADGKSAVVWSGPDATAYVANQIGWLVVNFEPPPFPVQAIKLTLNSAALKGYNPIDAIQLVGDP